MDHHEAMPKDDETPLLFFGGIWENKKERERERERDKQKQKKKMKTKVSSIDFNGNRKNVQQQQQQATSLASFFSFCNHFSTSSQKMFTNKLEEEEEEETRSAYHELLIQLHWLPCQQPFFLQIVQSSPHPPCSWLWLRC